MLNNFECPCMPTFICMNNKQVNECRLESAERYIKEGDGGKEEEEKWICTSNHLVKTSADGSISHSLFLCVSPSFTLSLSLMLSFCLALTDLLRGQDQNESPAPSSPHPLLSPVLHRLTASPPSFALTLSSSHGPSLYSRAL